MLLPKGKWMQPGAAGCECGLICGGVAYKQYQVWMPLVSINRRIMAWTPQRVPDLLPSTVGAEVKMAEAGKRIRQFAGRYVTDDKGSAKNMSSAWLRV